MYIMYSMQGFKFKNNARRSYCDYFATMSSRTTSTVVGGRKEQIDQQRDYGDTRNGNTLCDVQRGVYRPTTISTKIATTRLKRKRRIC